MIDYSNVSSKNKVA